MFAFDRSALAVLVPIALLAVAAWWSNRSPPAAPQQAQVQSEERAQTVAANLPSK